MGQYLYYKKREVRLNVAICEARGCNHLRRKEVGPACGFSRKRERMVKRREKKKGVLG